MLGRRPLSDRARALLERERERAQGWEADEAIKSRVIRRARSALERDRPSGVGLRLVGSGLAAVTPRRWLRPLPLVAAALAAAGLAAASAGLYSSREPEEKPWPPANVAPPPRPRVAVGGALLPAAPASEAPAERAPEPRPAPATTAGNDSTRSLNVKQYATELALLEPARSSLSRGDYSAALSALGQHRREFPNGQLSQEREALRVRALWGLGQKPAALAAARAFRKRYPRSALLSWLKDQGDQAP